MFTGYYLDSSQILEEKGSAGTVQYTWGNGLVRRGSEYPMTDGQGTTKLVTSSSQSITSTQETEAFGRTLATTGSTSNPFGYHGAEGYRQDGDGPAGLEPYQKVGARYYDPTFGRFITRDTDLSQSPYAYCDGDPVNSDDPSGHLHIPTMVPQPNDGPGGPSSDGSGDGDGDGEGLGGPGGTDPGGSNPGGGPSGGSGGGAGSGGIPVGGGVSVSTTSGGITASDGVAGVTANMNNKGQVTGLTGSFNIPLGPGSSLKLFGSNPFNGPTSWGGQYIKTWSFW